MNVGNVLTRGYDGQAGARGGTLTSLDVEQFLNLLIAQMRYQDPLEPMSEAEYLSQLAQITTVRELSDLNTQFAYATQAESIAQAASFIGKTIEGAEACGSGTLVLHFQGGQILKCFDDSPQYEAYSITSRGRRIIV